MIVGEIIDLLSSDAEDLPQRSAALKAAVPTKVATNSKFSYLPDGFDSSVNLDDNWDEAPLKRRKLSPKPEIQTGLLTRASLPPTDRQIVSAKSGFRGKAQRNKEWASIDEADPIFSSSSLQDNGASPEKRAIDQILSQDPKSEDSLPEGVFSAPVCRAINPSQLSERTVALLATLSETASRSKVTNGRKASRDSTAKRAKSTSQDVMDEGNASGTNVASECQAKPAKTSKKIRMTDEERAARAQEKEREKAAKAREKEIVRSLSIEQKVKQREEDAEKKRLLKEEKAKEKRVAAELAEVNKSKLDKKDSTPEMIVDLPASLDGQSVDVQTREFLKNLGVDTTLYQSQIPNIIRWRRKVKARWNTVLHHWEPIEHMEIQNEKHVICLLSANEFVSLTMANDKSQDVETHVTRLKSAYEDCIPIYLIEGLAILMRKNRTTENRVYQAKVLNQCQNDDAIIGSRQIASKRKKAAPEPVDEDMVEDALLRLQVINGCLVHHTDTSVQTAEWIATFTQHISTIPYRYLTSSA